MIHEQHTSRKPSLNLFSRYEAFWTHTLHLLGKGRIWGFCRRDETWATQKYASACSVAHDFSIQPLRVSNFICMGESYHVLCCTDFERISEASKVLWLQHGSIFVHWWHTGSVKGETISACTKVPKAVHEAQVHNAHVVEEEKDSEAVQK